jgi:LytS/YehU family sensor histidine kinase
LQVRSRAGKLMQANPAETSLTFRVQVPFWRSPDFYWEALLAGLGLLVVLGLLAVGRWFDNRRILNQQRAIAERERKVQFLQIQTLQSQMNPHFTFNALGTIQQLIASQDIELANESLLKLANLIRNYLEASMLGDEGQGSLFAHEIPLAQEIDLLQLYIDFEQLQYEGRFSYTIEVDNNLTPETYRVPPLILQPYVENAIKHGLLYQQEPGHLSIRFTPEEEEVLVCTIEDNGVGRQRARALQEASLKRYRSRGTELIKRRVELLNQMGYAIDINTHDRPEGGTLVRIEIGYQTTSP